MSINILKGLITLLFTCFLFNTSYAQTISFQGPSGVTSISSGTILELTAVGETSQKYIGSVPQFGYGSPYQEGITCELWETNYKYGNPGNVVAGKFKYKFTNTSWIPKTVTIVFKDLTMVHSQPSSFTFEDISFTIIIQPESYNKIQSMGFSTSNIVNLNSEYYLVEEDVLIKKISLSLTNPVYLANNDHNHNINILLENSIWNTTNWWYGILDAVEVWNSNPNSDIKLNLIYSEFDSNQRADIIIRSDEGGSFHPMKQQELGFQMVQVSQGI